MYIDLGDMNKMNKLINIKIIKQQDNLIDITI